MENIIISDKKELENKIKKISEQGKEKLHVISDFDRTLTRAFVNGQKSPTVIAQLRNSDYLGEDYVSRANELFDRYHPIEISLEVTIREKKRLMNEWWRKHFDLLLECGLNKKIMEEVISKKTLKFRKGSLDFMDLLKKNEIPLIILSAGVGDMITLYLEQEKRLHENIVIISNFFDFDKDGKVTRVREPIIHSNNKEEVEIKQLPTYRELIKRKNILLLGDSLEDVEMVRGFPYENLIKIGFLNENIEENLEEFKKNFDIIILGDGDFSYVNELIKKLIKI